MVIILLPVLALAGAVLLAQSDWFLAHAVPPYLRMLDAESSIRDRPCAVLMFGDSAALTGLEPWIIQQQTGLRACSIAQTKGNLGVSGVQFLRDYLARNPAPRILVLAFSPEDWRPIHRWGEVAYVEGVLQLVRHRPFHVYAYALVQHPNEAFGFVTYVYKAALESIATHAHSAVWPQSGSARDGHMTLPTATESHCLADDARALPSAITPVPEYVSALRREFSSNNTTVLLLSPTIPDCDPKTAFFADRLNPVLDQPIATQPIGNYNDIDRHFTAQGADAYSEQVASWINQRIRTSQTTSPSP